ncbi:MAG: hypothetical protein WC845_00320 [Candidatus Staskawiczbacteria bacterium]|jgi:hypothetical protein
MNKYIYFLIPLAPLSLAGLIYAVQPSFEIYPWLTGHAWPTITAASNTVITQNSTIKVTANITDVSGVSSAGYVIRRKSTGAQMARAILYDDGQIGNYDDVAGDGIYNARVDVSSFTPAAYKIFVFASDNLGNTNDGRAEADLGNAGEFLITGGGGCVTISDYRICATINSGGGQVSQINPFYVQAEADFREVMTISATIRDGDGNLIPTTGDTVNFRNETDGVDIASATTTDGVATASFVPSGALGDSILYVKYGGTSGNPTNHSGLLADYQYSSLIEKALRTEIRIESPTANNYQNYYFTTIMDVKEAGVWSFAIDGDDGVELEIDGAVVVGWYGYHGRCACFTHTGSVNLTAGLHRLVVRHENDTGGNDVILYYKSPTDASFYFFSTNLGTKAKLYAKLLPDSELTAPGFIASGLDSSILNLGAHTLKASYAGNSSLRISPSETTAPLEIIIGQRPLINPFTVPIETYIDDPINLSATLKYQNGNLISGQPVSFFNVTDNNDMGSAVTNGSGVASLSYLVKHYISDANRGKILYVKYAGDTGNPADHNALINDYTYTTVLDKGTRDAIDLFEGVVPPQDNTNYFFTTIMDVHIPGSWQFAVDGDDAVELQIDDNIVVGWYQHSTCSCTSHSNTITLSAGIHRVTVRHQNVTGNEAAVLYYKSPADGSWKVFGGISLGSGAASIYAELLGDSVIKNLNFIKKGIENTSIGNVSLKATYAGDEGFAIPLLPAESSTATVAVSGGTPTILEQFTVTPSTLNIDGVVSSILSAVLKDGAGAAMVNKIVTFVNQSDIFNIGSSTTSSAGEAHVTYVPKNYLAIDNINKVLFAEYGGTVGHPTDHAGLINDYVPSNLISRSLITDIGENSFGTFPANSNLYFSTILDITDAGQGTWGFAVDGEDAMEVEIDGSVLAGIYGENTYCSCYSHSGTVYLAKGPHRLIVRHEHDAGNAVALLWFQPPGGGWNTFRLSNLPSAMAATYAELPSDINTMKTRSFIENGLTNTSFGNLVLKAVFAGEPAQRIAPSEVTGTIKAKPSKCATQGQKTICSTVTISNTPAPGASIDSIFRIKVDSATDNGSPYCLPVGTKITLKEGTTVLREKTLTAATCAPSSTISLLPSLVITYGHLYTVEISTATECTGFSSGGNCWYLGNRGQSCAGVCSDKGGNKTADCSEEDLNCSAIAHFGIACDECIFDSGEYGSPVAGYWYGYGWYACASAVSPMWRDCSIGYDADDFYFVPICACNGIIPNFPFGFVVGL